MISCKYCVASNKKLLTVILAVSLFVTKAHSEVGDESAYEVIIIQKNSDTDKQKDTTFVEQSGGGKSIDLDMPDDENLQQYVKPDLSGQMSNLERNAWRTSKIKIGIDEARLEYTDLTRHSEAVESQSYGYLAMSGSWSFNSRWEARIAGRLDGYKQSGSPEWSGVDSDYGESYLRYRGNQWNLTLGTQKVIWGRVDEIPPNDRLSTPDLTRFVMNDLPDRRRARPMIRAEYFNDDKKLDIIVLPVFREAELPRVESIWYPIDRNRGKVLGMDIKPLFGWIIGYAKIVDEPPDDDNGIGLRYSQTEENYEFALTAQHGRQTVPYFSYTLRTNTFTAIYPKFSSIGFDLGTEKSGFTWRFEAAAIDKVSVTQADLTCVEVKGVNWVVAVESFPGDGDSRLNIQLAGNHLLDTPEEIYERKNMYNLMGSFEMPFSRNRWRAKMDFLIGLDKQDIYLNPSISFLGWEPQEVFLEGHIFDGDEGTPGGYHDKHSQITLGWRSSF